MKPPELLVQRANLLLCNVALCHEDLHCRNRDVSATRNLLDGYQGSSGVLSQVNLYDALILVTYTLFVLQIYFVNTYKRLCNPTRLDQ